jgi:acetoacetyl-CoA reductase
MPPAQELANKGVTVNTVSPGYIGTDVVNAIKPEILEKIEDRRDDSGKASRYTGRNRFYRRVAGGRGLQFHHWCRLLCNGGLHMG